MYNFSLKQLIILLKKNKSIKEKKKLIKFILFKYYN